MVAIVSIRMLNMLRYMTLNRLSFLNYGLKNLGKHVKVVFV